MTSVAETFSAAIETVRNHVPQIEYFQPYGDGYKISNCGRCVNKHGKEVSPGNNGNGYLYFNLKICGKRRNLYLHRLVALLFVENPQPLFYRDVNHVYSLPSRWNRADCLSWCTRSQNLRDRYIQRKRLGLPKLTPREQAHINASINAAHEVSKKKVVYGGITYESITALADAFGVSQPAISKALRSGKGTWRGKEIRFAS